MLIFAFSLAMPRAARIFRTLPLLLLARRAARSQVSITSRERPDLATRVPDDAAFGPIIPTPSMAELRWLGRDSPRPNHRSALFACGRAPRCRGPNSPRDTAQSKARVSQVSTSAAVSLAMCAAPWNGEGVIA